MIRFACPACGKLLRAPDEAVGRQTPCTRCGQRLMILPPGPSQEKTTLRKVVPRSSAVPGRAPAKLSVDVPAEPSETAAPEWEGQGRQRRLWPLLVSVAVVLVTCLVVFLILVLKARAPERRKPQMAFKQEASEAVPGPSGAKGEISKLPETPSGVRGEEKGGAADPSEPKEERPAVLPQTDPNKHPKGAAPTDPKGDAFSQLSEALRNRGSPPGGVPKRTESAQPGSNVPAAPVREDTKPGRRKSSPAVDSSPSPSPRTG